MLDFFKNLFVDKQTTTNEQPADAEQASPTESSSNEDIALPKDEAPADSKKRRPPRRNSRRSGNAPRKQDASQYLDTPLDLDDEHMAELQRLEQFVLFVAKSLVVNPDGVSTRLSSQGDLNVILISCDKPDTGKLIGRSGKIIASIRTLVNGAAGKTGLKASVDIVD